MNSSRFYFFHPTTIFLYFLFIILLTMFSTNPLILLISLVGGITFNCLITKMINFKSLCFYVIIFLITAFSNPIFSHNGATNLFYLGDNAVTLESFLYGVNVGLLIIAVMVWCKNYSLIMTNDKFLYLFSKPLPKTALILSMTIRFIPLFIRKYRNIVDAQKGLGTFSSNKLIDKIKFYISIFSLLVTWSLENSIDTANSMKSRGYNLKNKTTYSNFKFRMSDLVNIIVFVVLFLLCLLGLMKNAVSFYFYPIVTFTSFSTIKVITISSFFVLSFLPAIIELKENLKWKYLISKI